MNATQINQAARRLEDRKIRKDLKKNRTATVRERPAGRVIRWNHCTCPAKYDHTVMGHLPDCPTWACNQRGCVIVGKIGIRELARGKFWLEVLTGRNAGEGMETTEAKLAKVIEQFYRREF